MARYMVSWKANASVWPTDPKEVLGALEAATGGADQLLAGGALKELGWFTPHEGFAIFEADSKESVLGMVQGFFPYYTPEFQEIVPWEAGKKAILESARQAASR
jgi:hypothetical protein